MTVAKTASESSYVTDIDKVSLVIWRDRWLYYDKKGG